MAKEKRRKLTYIQKALILGAIVIGIQLYLLWQVKSENTEGIQIKDFIANVDHATKNWKAEDEEAEKLKQFRQLSVKVKLALFDYRQKNEKYPETLEELVPAYFPELPIDPRTGEVLNYQTYRDTFQIGDSLTDETPTPTPDPNAEKVEIDPETGEPIKKAEGEAEASSVIDMVVEDNRLQ